MWARRVLGQRWCRRFSALSRPELEAMTPATYLSELGMEVQRPLNRFDDLGFQEAAWRLIRTAKYCALEERVRFGINAAALGF